MHGVALGWANLIFPSPEIENIGSEQGDIFLIQADCLSIRPSQSFVALSSGKVLIFEVVYKGPSMRWLKP